MQKLIDLEVARAYAEERWPSPVVRRHIDALLEGCPKVEAPGIVRCVECKHSIINERHESRPLICCLTKMCGTTEPDWFCADGERKENDAAD